MSDTSHDEEEKPALQVFRQAAEREVQPEDWGFCAYGDASVGSGGGIPGFFWFETAEAMKAALRDHALLLHPPMSGFDLASIKAAVEATVAGAGSTEDLRARLNACLVNCSQFTWIGSFRGLCEEKSSEAQKVRGEFRDEREGRAHSGPIAVEEMADFVEFLYSYGI